MANFEITQGSGTTIATDVGGGGENYQKIKLIDATIGSTAGTGISTNPFQVSLEFTGANTTPLIVDGSGVTQPVSGTVSASQSGTWNITNISGTISLPTGAATEATLADVKIDLDQFTFVASNLLVDGSGVTQPISALVLPLPTGAATQVTLAEIKSDTDNLDVALSTRASESTVSNIQTQTDKLTFVSSNLLVDGSGVTQPVSGTITANAGTGNFTVVQSVGANLHAQIDNFPSSQTVNGTIAATQSGTWTVSLSSGSIEIGTVDQGSPNTLANAWPVELTDGTNTLGIAAHPIRIDPTGTTTQPVSGAVSVSNFPATQPVSGSVTVTQGTGTNLHTVIDSGTVTVGNATIAVTQSTSPWIVSLASTTITGTVASTQSGTWNINNISGTVSLPTGASTAAKQPALGVAGTASSDVITVQGIASMTALKVDGSAVTQPISGTITANAGTGNFTVVQSTGTNLHTVIDSGTITANIGTTNGLALDSTVSKLTLAQGSTTSGQTGPLIQGSVTTSSPSYTTAQTSPLSLTLAGALRVDASSTVQPVSGTITANAGTGSFTVVQATGTNLHTVVDSGTITVGNSTLAVTQSGTWTVALSTESIEIGKVDQGAPATLTNAWPVELTDGTNVLGVSAHPVRTDPTGTTTQPVSGTITANAGTGNFTVVQTTGTNLHAVLDSGSTTAVTGNVTVVQGTGTNLHTVVDSGTVTANIGTTNGLALDTTVAKLNLVQGSATSGQSGPLIQGSVTTSAPTYTNTQTSPLSLTVAGALRVDGSGVTQPVSISGTVPVSGTVAVTQSTSPWVVSLASTTITGTVAVTQSTSPWVISGTVTANIGTTNGLALDASVTGLQVSQGSTTSGEKGPLIQGAVTTAAPTYSTTQTSPLSLTTAGALRVDASSTTQPVSGSVTVTQGTGTNLHTVIDSGTVTVGNATIAVTQSGTWTVQPGNTPNTTPWLSTINQGGNSAAVTASSALKVDGSAVTQPISGTITANAGTGNFTVVQSTGTNLHAVVDSGSITVTQGTPANLNATVTQQTITKGTQGSTGVTTQDLKDAGRSFITFTADAIAGVTAEALVTFTLNKAGTATASQTNYTITSGKTLRIQALSASVQAGAAAGEWVRAKLRINTAGATTATSNLVITVEAGNIAATTATAGSAILSIPDGLEITGNGTITIGLSHISSATTNVESITLIGYEY